jgi:hypothetical protein
LQRKFCGNAGQLFFFVCRKIAVQPGNDKTGRSYPISLARFHCPHFTDPISLARFHWRIGMGTVSSEVAILLEEHDWNSTIPRLLYCAKRQCDHLYWQSGTARHPPDGEEISTLVSRTIKEICSGERQWHPRRDPDLFAFLLGILRSEIAHLAEGWKTCHSVSIKPNYETENLTGEIFGLLRADAAAQPPEDRLPQPAHEHQRAGCIWEFLAELRDDPFLHQYVLCICRNMKKTSEIARLLNLAPQEVYQMRQELRTRLRHFLQQQHGAQTTAKEKRVRLSG